MGSHCTFFFYELDVRVKKRNLKIKEKVKASCIHLNKGVYLLSFKSGRRKRNRYQYVIEEISKIVQLPMVSKENKRKQLQ